MLLNSRFLGELNCNDDQIVEFPTGMIGLSSYHQWALIEDPVDQRISWLQSVGSSEIALPLIRPKDEIEQYDVRVSPELLQPLRLSDSDRLGVYSVVEGYGPNQIFTNLRAPVLINMDRHLGVQVVTNDEQPMQLELIGFAVNFRKSA